MVKDLVTVFPTSIRPRMRKINWDGLEEIRVRIGWPVELIYGNHNEWLGNYDSMIDRQCLDEMLNYITGYSMYALEEEIKQGYITFSGGHRIGITGHVTYETLRDVREPRITNLIDIGGLNIRISHERKGCAEKICSHLRCENSIYHTLIFAAPGVGKTTYLRDLIRMLSEGEEGLKVCVIDERSEIGACIDGKPQNDLGRRTDILDACPKIVGMQMALRSMSPDVIAVDEIGRKEEFVLLEQMKCSGVKVLGTMHGADIHEVMRKAYVKPERFVELIRLPNGHRTFHIYDEKGNLLCGKY